MTKEKEHKKEKDHKKEKETMVSERSEEVDAEEGCAEGECI